MSRSDLREQLETLKLLLEAQHAECVSECHEREMNGPDDRENLELEAEVKGKLLAVIDMCRECGEARSELHLASARVKSLHYKHMNNMQAFCQEQFAAQAMQNAQLIQAVKNSHSKKVT